MKLQALKIHLNLRNNYKGDICLSPFFVLFLYFNKAKYFLLHVISRHLTISAAMLLLLFVISLLLVLSSVSLCIVCRVCRSDNQFNVWQDSRRVITAKVNLILYPVFKLVCGIWPSAVD